MTILSCLAIGIAFLLAVVLLVLSAVVIGLRIPVRKDGEPPSPRENGD
ncbi:MAG: hypothetical protein ABI592_12410 [Acidobacteriota bacterium]